jgi:hypothetical protein
MLIFIKQIFFYFVLFAKKIENFFIIYCLIKEDSAKMAQTSDLKNINNIEAFINLKPPVEYIEPMSPPDQEYATKKIGEFKKSSPGTLCPVGYSGYTCYAFYRNRVGKDYFVTFSGGKILCYAELQ